MNQTDRRTNLQTDRRTDGQADRLRRAFVAGAALLLTAACARPAAVGPAGGQAPAPQPVAAAPAPARVDTPPTGRPPAPKARIAPPQVAWQLGLMPVASTGVSRWRTQRPTADGRGVLIAILDSGVDAGIAGLATTSTGEPKILDLRDFSDEGLVRLQPITVEDGRIVLSGGVTLTGSAVPFAAAAGSGTWYGGVLEETTFGPLPEGDLNGNGTNTDRYGVVVVRSRAGWVALIDLNADGSLADERPVADYLAARETFTFASRWVPRGRGPVTAALNISEVDGAPRLVVFLDNSGHGSHVAGIAAGNDIYGQSGLDGVAPGAQILGLKISNNMRGGVTTTGSMQRAMEYAAGFARARNLPLVLNMSFGIGNSQPGRAVMDSIVDAFLRANPGVVFTIAAGNDGPGTNTIGLPGTAGLALSVGATYPASIAALQFGVSREVLGWWSARGGSMARPDLVAPGLAYSTVPAWNSGDEVKGGTSMAAPHVAGLAALLISAARQQGGAAPNAGEIGQALRAGSRLLAGEPVLDQGAGLPDINLAWNHLAGRHGGERFDVRAIPPGGGGARPGVRPGNDDVAPSSRGALPSAAYRPTGLASPGDTIQRFRVSLQPGATPGSRRYRLASDVNWLRAVPASVTVDSVTGSALIEVRYDAARLAAPGRYAGSIMALSATDSNAAPAFALLNTVVAAEPALPVAVRGATLSAGRTRRWSVVVPEGAAGLVVNVAVRDSSMAGQLFIFEPTGRPARLAKAPALGGADSTAALVVIGADDIVPGTWELVLQAMPGADITYDLRVALAAVRITPIEPASAPSLRLVSANDTALASTLEEVGIEKSFTLRLGPGVWREAVEVPAWATRAVAEVEVTPLEWNRVTDFAITFFDSASQRLGNGAMNYPFHRVAADLPENRVAGYEVTLDLFPGFAHARGDSLEARVRLRFEGPPRRLTGQAAARFAERVVAGSYPRGNPVPPGWRRVMRLTVGAGDGDPAATVKHFTVDAP